ncbi:enoyl-CoA-hydratase DpgB [Streptomyces rapamycinicus]|uniref:Isomerase DpgB n=1 Tax=Streptomyces rapamycinicus TaxID=1226757 RepID=A0ABR6LCA9_9ACTN|nr:enoyl-CoA-hydratase DpgB [Streptomyces rapamycinicus]MBB4779104.1 isomerase DpgB [Streptomyces rapamycinicus]UTP27926.1 enoyl-CoA hydratase/isomerase family protein [Streptomyces rapamycinicus NRRL 5491]
MIADKETDPDRTLLPDGMGILARLDGGSPLPELTAAVNAVCEEAEEPREPTVVVLRFAPSPPGAREWPGDVSIHEVNRWERAVRRLERLDNLTIAVAQGTCGGPVLDLLLAAAFRIGTPDLKLVLPVNDEHFWPGMVLYRLVQHIGPARARRIVLWGSDIPLPDAIELGIVDEVSNDVTEAVRNAAALRGRLSDREARIRRRLLEEATSAEYQDALGAHLAACDRELRRLRNGGPGTPAGTAAGHVEAAG